MIDDPSYLKNLITHPPKKSTKKSKNPQTPQTTPPFIYTAINTTLIENTIISGAERLRKLGPFEFPPPVVAIWLWSSIAESSDFPDRENVACKVSRSRRPVKFVRVVYFYVSRLFAATLPVWPENGTTPPVWHPEPFIFISATIVCRLRCLWVLLQPPPLMSFQLYDVSINATDKRSLRQIAVLQFSRADVNQQNVLGCLLSRVRYECRTNRGFGVGLC